MSEATLPYPEFKAILYDAIEDEGLWEKQPDYEALSQREIEVLLLIAEKGSPMKILQNGCFLHSRNTVKGTKSKSFSKLHVQRRTEAVAIAKKIGLI